MAAASILAVDPRHPQPRVLERVLKILREGGLVAYPTDTFYAVGCDLDAKKAIDRLYVLKGRDRRKPFALLCPDLSDVARYAHVSNFAYRTLKKLTPGPYTFVLEATRLVPQAMTSGQKQVGLRVPEAPVAVALAKDLGRPLVTTSACTSASEPLLDARDIKDAWGNRLDLILDGGPTPNIASTVVSLLDDAPVLLRQGRGSVEGFIPA